MHVVFENDTIHYAGDDLTEAMKIFESKVTINPRVTFRTVDSLSEVFGVQAQTASKPTESSDLFDEVGEVLSEAAEAVFGVLDCVGLNEKTAENVCDGAKQAVAEVRSLGIKGMKVVGDQFIALGELLRNAGVDESEPSEKK